MEDKIPFHPDNKVYSFADLKPRFVTKLQIYFRKLKLKVYKNKKVKQSKTPHHRHFYMKFRLNINDDINPQTGHSEYEIIVPARAAFFARLSLEKSIKEKIQIDVTDWEEITDEEYEEYLTSKDSFEKRVECNHDLFPIGRKSDNRFQCSICHDEIIKSKD